MQKARLIVLLAIICIFVMSITAYAQLPTTNWPKTGRDYHNSSHSPATAIAKPVIKWSTECMPYGNNSNQWRTTTYNGLTVDPSGNVLAYANYCFGLVAFNTSGTKIHTSNISDMNMSLYYNGPTITNDGRVICGPQQGSAFRLYAANLSDLSNITSFVPPLINSSYYQWAGYSAPNSAAFVSPAVGPDGSIYAGNLTMAQLCAPYGVVAAYNSDGTAKWKWGDTAPGGVGGRSFGSYAIKQIDDGGTLKNVIYASGGVWKQFVDSPCIAALRDDGTSCTELWKKAVSSNETGFYTSTPVLSDDGSTVYAAGWETYPSSGTTRNSTPGSLFAYNADTGAVKWNITTGGRHSFQPALGPGDANGPMLYLTGGVVRTATVYANEAELSVTPGKIIAVKDNGTSAKIMWTLELPDDAMSDTTAIATISTNPTVIYVATGNARVYCIQDMGSYGKILWDWQGYCYKWCHNTSVSYEPAGIVVADDGTVYVGLKNVVYAFDASNGGFNVSSPNGISGYVKDASGNAIKDAWVSAKLSTDENAQSPLADNARKIWTKTDESGYYQMSLASGFFTTYPATINIAAGAVGYAASATKTLTYNSSADLANVNVEDFSLGTAKFNRSIASSATAANASGGYPASNAVDGDMTTCYTSTVVSDLTVDLGERRTISEAAIYWQFHCGKAYTVDYSDDGLTWNNAYTTAVGNGGFPLSWYVNNPDTNNGCPGGPQVAADVITFAPTTAQYWRVNFTSAATPPIGTVAQASTTANFLDYNPSTYASIWEFELRDATKNGITSSSLADVKKLDDGDGVVLSNLRVTAVAGGGVPANTFFVENADRTAGIKVQMASLPTTIQFGDKVSIVGRVYTDFTNAEKYIQATTVTRLDSTTSPTGPAIAELSMNNKAAADPISQDLFIKTWGKVSDSATGSFMISDGSAAPIKVLCSSDGTVTMPADNDYIRVRGVVSKDADGPVLYMRNERADWAYGSDNMQALPFTGNYKYPIQYLVLGPFKDPNVTENYYQLLDEDFIGNGGENGATTIIGSAVMPKEGMVTAGKTWFAAASTGPSLDLNKAFGGTTEHAVAYVHLYLWSETAQPTVAITTGSDDWLRVYVNGTFMYDIDETTNAGQYLAGRGVNPGDDNPVSISLNQGLNSILFKVVNGGSSFGLNSQFIDDSFIVGGPGYGGYQPYTATGLGYSLNPAQ